MKKIINILLGSIALFLFVVTPAFAHVVVKPEEVSIGEFKTFTIEVPNEKDNPVVGLRLIVPDGLSFVAPNVKPGWDIDIKKSGSGKDTKVIEINWTGGSIPAGQRDDFFLNAQVPTHKTTLKWKAYQTYANGMVVSWDWERMMTMDYEDREKTEETVGLASNTRITNDLEKVVTESQKDNLTWQLSILALAISVVALGLHLWKKNKSSK